MAAANVQLSEMFTRLQFASSVLSAQSLMLSHRDSMGMHTPEEHMNWDGGHNAGSDWNFHTTTTTTKCPALVLTWLCPPLELSQELRERSVVWGWVLQE